METSENNLSATGASLQNGQVANEQVENEPVENRRSDDGTQSAGPSNGVSKPIPPAGRQMNRDEAIEYVFEKNEELLRRLA